MRPIMLSGLAGSEDPGEEPTVNRMHASLSTYSPMLTDALLRNSPLEKVYFSAIARPLWRGCYVVARTGRPLLRRW